MAFRRLKSRIHAYYMKCRVEMEINSAKSITMKNGRECVWLWHEGLRDRKTPILVQIGSICPLFASSSGSQEACFGLTSPLNGSEWFLWLKRHVR
jgi:hypothetical protein